MAVQEGQLIAMLRDFSEEAAVLGEKPVGDPVKTVDDWCSENFGILTKYFDRDGEVVCEMTADAHRVVSFIQNLTTTEFVAAESKIKALWRDIENMVERATSNPGDRLIQIETQIEALTKEAERIRTTGEITTLTPSQINQDFVRLVGLMREIPGDFRTVEEKLQQVASTISTKMMEEDANRGDIVRMALDADEQLRRSEQGQSFDGFWQFLVAPGQREQFEEMVELLYSIGGLSDQNRDNPAFRALFSTLLREGEKVIRSQQRLSAQLRRAMDIGARTHRRLLLQGIKEARKAAYARRSEFVGDRGFIHLNDESTLSSFMTRPLYERPVHANLSIVMAEAGPPAGKDLLAQFGGMSPIRLAQMRTNVRRLLEARKVLTLPDILEVHPPENGVIEVVAYIAIAAECPRNYIAPDLFHEVTLAWMNPPAVLRVPQLLIEEIAEDGKAVF